MCKEDCIKNKVKIENLADDVKDLKVESQEQRKLSVKTYGHLMSVDERIISLTQQITVNHQEQERIVSDHLEESEKYRKWIEIRMEVDKWLLRLLGITVLSAVGMFIKEVVKIYFSKR